MCVDEKQGSVDDGFMMDQKWIDKKKKKKGKQGFDVLDLEE